MAYTEKFVPVRTTILRLIFGVCFLFCLQKSTESSPLNSKDVAAGIVSIFFFINQFIVFSFMMLLINLLFVKVKHDEHELNLLLFLQNDTARLTFALFVTEISIRRKLLRRGSSVKLRNYKFYRMREFSFE